MKSLALSFPANLSVPPIRLNVDTDVWLFLNPRVAGVESGRIHNVFTKDTHKEIDRGWIDCTFGIRPAATPTRGHQRGFEWTAEFKTTDGGVEPRETFTGVSDSRKLALNAVWQALSKKINAVAEERKRYRARTEAALAESVKADVAIGDGFMHQEQR